MVAIYQLSVEGCRRCGDEPRPYGLLVRRLVTGWDPQDVETLAELLERLAHASEPVAYATQG